MPDEEHTPAKSPAKTPKHPATPAPSRWPVSAALVIALIAVGLAIWALLRPAAEPAESAQQPEEFTTEQSGQAKVQACTAFNNVREAVALQTNINLGPDPGPRAAVAANARLATLGGGGYLLTQVDPATPTDLAAAVRSFANNLQEIGMKQLVGAPPDDPALTAELGQAQEATGRIAEMCR